MRGKKLLWFICFFILVFPSIIFGQNGIRDDSLSHKQERKIKREDFKKTQRRYFLNLETVYARLYTEAAFEIFDGFLTAKIGLEDNLGLPGRRTFFTGTFMHRFTPASGLYARYYGINRRENKVTEEDFIFLDDTIPAGTSSTAYFNTQVISAGYLLSIKQDPNAFLGAYFNIYLIWLETGVESDIGNIKAKLDYAVPLPNFGLLAMFRLKKWLFIEGTIGFFSLQLDEFDGSLFDFTARLVFKPTKWLGIDLSYQEFDINVNFPFESINTTIEYNFRGPGVGLNFSF